MQEVSHKRRTEKLQHEMRLYLLQTYALLGILDWSSTWTQGSGATLTEVDLRKYGLRDILTITRKPEQSLSTLFSSKTKSENRSSNSQPASDSLSKGSIAAPVRDTVEHVALGQRPRPNGGHRTHRPTLPQPPQPRGPQIIQQLLHSQSRV